MTEEQERLVIDNHNLIYHFIHKFGVPIDEYYGICAIGLCEASLKYQPDKGTSFSTFASIIIKQNIMMELRKRSTRNKYISYMTNISTDEEYSVSVLDKITNGLSAYDEILPYDLGKILTHREYTIVSLILKGCTQTQIASSLKTSQSAVSRSLKSIRTKLNEGG